MKKRNRAKLTDLASATVFVATEMVKLPLRPYAIKVLKMCGGKFISAQGRTPAGLEGPCIQWQDAA